jgi:DHA1 family bicyclomycin/chloramphenicol resistance-like MFS transporter
MRETHPAANRHKAQESFIQSYAALLRRPRFNAYVLQTGFNTGAFMVMAVAASSMMTELLHRPATEYGLYFLLFPLGFFTGNFISTRIGGRFPAETMVLAGSVLTLVAVAAQATALSIGFIAPIAFFLPGTFVTMAQGISLPSGQAAAMAEIPRLAGTAAGIGVFMQNFWAAVSTQAYGLLADGTPGPMTVMALTCACLTFLLGAIPYLLKRKAASATPA